MKIQKECVPCLLKRALFETELSTVGKKNQTAAVKAACKLLSEQYDPAICSTTIATQVHKIVYKTLQDKDPYVKLKMKSSKVAQSFVPVIDSLIASSVDPLKTSMICSIVGNILDFGIEGSGSHPNILKDMFYKLFDEGLGYDDYPKLQSLLGKSIHCMLFTDNCGEIIFDKILCRELKEINPHLHITAVVKGEPVLTDATIQDATAISLSDVVDELFTTGCFAVGVDFLRLPKRVIRQLGTTDLVISKGMANFESFSETNYKPIVYLLRTKCHAIAKAMNLPQNISVIKVYD